MEVDTILMALPNLYAANYFCQSYEDTGLVLHAIEKVAGLRMNCRVYAMSEG